MEFDAGVDEEGEQVLELKKISHVKGIANDEDIFAVAQSLISLQTRDNTRIIRVDQSLLNSN
jgi:hypothetical protein